MKVHLITSTINQAERELEARQQVGSRRLQPALSCVVIYCGKQLRHGAIVVLAAGSALRF
ncbi:MAG: hypothetical protein JRJ12_07085 [Deltaproteobacteria bacterium]|nr:hypothetical protein [Deltaproteobacteria bacterium]MBW2071131.1 hypothetical protein [Deltaproteobacteria bacterium]